MENKRKRITDNDSGKVIGKAGSSNPRKSKTEERLPKKEQANAGLKDQTEQTTMYVNKPHMLFR
jgi:hypothetical protein